ncbi:MAG: hydroxyisourate hydrolase [Pyrinomonadaceae bacterium]
MSKITTHVLDTSSGRPAAGITVTLEREFGDGWQAAGEGRTDADGRLADLMGADEELSVGAYRLTFDAGSYFAAHSTETFYPQVVVVFRARGEEHYHVPLLLSPFGYSTYRGS